ncbi:hypothetical protein [Sphingomonas sp. Leaf257]|jgi:hypothetical protein|uniref:hypothetical protein n=1 Tax=Sphingomonas sp. Leaf257 TaxID=1736309 RepID=UPI000B1D4708|nr:hypothetical protein [Sphingomonas sp. Leaf257]
MNKAFGVLALAILASGCESKNKDETPALTGRHLSPAENAKFDIEGARPGETRVQAIQKFKKSLPGHEIELFSDIYTYAKAPFDTITLTTQSDLPTRDVIKIERRREFPNGTSRDAVMKLLRSKFGNLVEPNLQTVNAVGDGKRTEVSNGLYFAGEGVTADGKILSRCADASGFSFSAGPSVDCGLMVRVKLSGTPELVKIIEIEMINARAERAIEKRAALWREKQEQADRTAEMQNAEVVNSL